MRGDGASPNGSGAGAAPGSEGRPPRPRPMRGDLSKLPEALAPLTNLSQFVIWRYEFVDGKWTKPPRNPRTKELASTIR
jgi:hypothetical protein